MQNEELLMSSGNKKTVSNTESSCVSKSEVITSVEDLVIMIT